MKLTGDPHPLDRLVSVQPNTVVVVLSRTAPTAQTPGRIPHARAACLAAPSPSAGVDTAPVELDVIVDHLMTLDGHEIERCLVESPFN